MTDAQLKAVLKTNKTGEEADRTFAGATLAVRASVEDVERAFDLAARNASARTSWRR